MTPQHQVSYSLSQDETLELKTTTNLVQTKIAISFTPPQEGTIYIVFKCVDLSLSKWVYVITECMADAWNDNHAMTGVPSDEIKVWQITRTSTSLVVVCNGVTVLNFNFHTDYRDDFSTCYESWTQTTAIQFYYNGDMYGDTSHLFMRIERHG